MLNVVLLVERWAMANPASSISCVDHMIVNTLSRLNCNLKVFYFDELHCYGKTTDDVILNYCSNNPTDVLVFDYYNFADNSPNMMLSLGAINRLKELKVKVVSIWFDTKLPDTTNFSVSLWNEQQKSYLNTVDLNVVVDADVNSGNIISLFVPQDDHLYFDNNFSRIYDTIFVGTMNRNKQRASLLRKLSSCRDINFINIDSNQLSNNRLTPEEYASFYQRAKIGININNFQMKSRAYEIMLCGAMLLTDWHPVLDKYFVSGEDYVAYQNFNDLVEKCRYYLGNPSERSRIAQNGHGKVLKLNSKAFWRAIFDRLCIIKDGDEL